MNCCPETLSYLLTHEIQLLVDKTNIMTHKSQLLRKFIKEYQLLEVKFVPFQTYIIEENNDTPEIISRST